MVWIMTVLWVTMLATPLALLVALLPAGRDCPRCGSETMALRSRLLHGVRRWAARRWCACCGWEGMTRAGLRREAPPAPVPVVPHEADDDAAWRSGPEGGSVY